MVQAAISANHGSGIPQPKHQPKLGSFIYILATTAAIGGFLFGYDTGIVSEAMLYVEKNDGMKPMDNIWKELIVAITPGIAGIGSLVAGNSSDRLGRKKVILIASVIFTIGGLICAAAFNKPVLLVGRVLLGFAIGVASMIVPVYVSEASPANIRGFLVTGFQLMVTFGLVAANIIAGSFSYIDPERVGWRLMFGFAALPAAIQFIGFLFLPESPRYQYKKYGSEASKEVLQRIYNGDEEWIEYELEEIRTNHEEQVKAQMEYGGDGIVFFRILATPDVRKALLLGCTVQAFAQMSGINTIMYYTGTIIKSSGIRDIHENIWISCGTAGINFFATFFPLYMIERVGRRILFLGSITGVLLSLCLLGGGFLLINKDSATVYQPGDHQDLYTYNSSWFDENGDQYSKCIKYSNCDYCVTNENCGFCTHKSENNKWGFCLPGKNNKSDTVSDTGYCNSPTSSDTDIYHNITLDEGQTWQIWEWDDSFCQSKYTFLPIVIIIIYLVSFASGYGVVPWVLNSEFYPFWARSTCAALGKFTNWMFNLLISLTFLSLSEAITKFGAFFLYAAITSVGLVIFFFFVPETKGLNLDEIEMLFMGKEEKQRMQENIRKQHLTKSNVHENGYDKNEKYDNFNCEI